MNRINYFWEDWSSSSSSNEDDEEEVSLYIEKRQYKMLPRVGLEKWDDKDFMYRFRLSKPTKMMVLDLIKDSLPCDERRSRELRPITQLLIVLRYYALGSIQLAIADFIGVSISTVHNILKRVSRAIANLAPRFIRMPGTQSKRIEAASDFFSKAKFPRTIGAIDCTHIRIQSPGGNDAENFRNRKGWFSLVGRAQHMTSVFIFNLSSLKQRFEAGEFSHFIIIGDVGYKNRSYLATPFQNVTYAAEKLYNDSQIRSRNCVERLYGVWKRRFPVLATGLKCRIETAQVVTIACAVLHNISIDQNDSRPPPEVPGFNDLLAGIYVPSAVPLEAISTAPHNTIRSRLIRTYFQPMLNRTEINVSSMLE